MALRFAVETTVHASQPASSTLSWLSGELGNENGRAGQPRHARSAAAERPGAVPRLSIHAAGDPVPESARAERPEWRKVRFMAVFWAGRGERPEAHQTGSRCKVLRVHSTHQVPGAGASPSSAADPGCRHYWAGGAGIPLPIAVSSSCPGDPARRCAATSPSCAEDSMQQLHQASWRCYMSLRVEVFADAGASCMASQPRPGVPAGPRPAAIWRYRCRQARTT